MAANPRDEVFDFTKTLVGDDAVGMLSKLLWEMQQIFEYKGDESAIRAFMSYNAASTAWHIHEWLWKLCPDDQRSNLLEVVNAKTQDFDGYVRGLQLSNGAIAICRQIATAGKHVGVKYNRDDIAGEIHHDAETGATAVKFKWNDRVVDDLAVYAEALHVWMRIYVGLGFKEAEKLASVVAEIDGWRAAQQGATANGE